MTKAELTRRTILLTAFKMIYKHGYQATSVDDIIASMKLTKGAFYYHFKSKDDMGLAVIREIMHPGMSQLLIKPLLDEQDSLKGIYEMMKGLLNDRSLFDVKYGCPAINLIDEMAAISKPFSSALSLILSDWQDAIRKCIESGKSNQRIRADVSQVQVAYFIAAGYGGIRNMGKIYGDACYKTYLKELKNYLESMAVQN